jgi:DNA polymerase I-like protein with 3'-5' exonuclease and polymerase domains
MCKKLGHGSNYGGKAATLSSQAKLPLSVVTDFQPKYFRAFPAHLQWQAWVDAEIRRKGELISLTGRKRQFWGRRNDDATLREAIAYDPQCSLAEIVNRAMLRIWRERTAILMMHDHDALTFMYPEHLEDEIVPKLQQMLPEEIQLNNNRILKIPYDCKVGWNKADFHETKNPQGLKDYVPGDKRKRETAKSLLDRAPKWRNGKA